jgi:hypothetical protein
LTISGVPRGRFAPSGTLRGRQQREKSKRRKGKIQEDKCGKPVLFYYSKEDLKRRGLPENKLGKSYTFED